MSNSYTETFGRVDGEHVVNEICTYEKEDNYSNRTIVAVVEFKSGYFGFGVQYIEDDVECEEYPKFFIKRRGLADETTAIEEAEKYFNENVK